MDNTHEVRYKKALRSIQELYSDTSVSKEMTREALNDLVSEIEIMLEALDL